MSKMPDSSLITAKALKHLKKRRAADARFRLYGIAAIVFALSALALLVIAIGTRAYSATTQYVYQTEILLQADLVAPEGETSEAEITRNIEGFYTLVRDKLFTEFPEATQSQATRQELSELVNRLAVLPLAERVAANPTLIGKSIKVRVPLSDDLDLYFKGSSPKDVTVRVGSAGKVQTDAEGSINLTGTPGLSKVVSTRSLLEEGQTTGSVLLAGGDAVARVEALTADAARLTLLTGELEDLTQTPLIAHIIPLPEAERPISDQQIAWAIALKQAGNARRVLHTSLLTHTDSTYPELAGTLAAIVGSLLTMMVTACVAIPMGIFAAVYLEEFAPRNRLTNLIEVNINNLAAVPSIVFGLLGASLLLGTFGLPRSAPIVGGLVLALLILPVVIIASRASLRSVPPSIRSGALAVGASRMQAVFHHVLPLAAPGMFTGAILGMARALGETAPLLLIGMVAFVAEVPNSATDEATALPVLIYSWASNAERAWEPMTAAAIVILLSLLVIMNVVVVFLRRRFERRW